MTDWFMLPAIAGCGKQDLLRVEVFSTLELMKVDALQMNEDAPLPADEFQSPDEDACLSDADQSNEPPLPNAAPPGEVTESIVEEEKSPFATRWRQIYRTNPRAMGRSATLSALGTWQSFLPGTKSLLSQPRVQVLMLHHVFEDEEPRFQRLLKFLSRTHALVSYSEALRRAEAGGAEVDRPFVAITFDDGFKNCVRAAEILKEFNATACFFVCPSVIGETDMEKLDTFCRERLELRSVVEFMDADDLEKIKKAGHEIGGHTMTHANLAKVTPQQVSDEIGECFNVIKRNFGEAKHFAWTYGKFTDCSPEAVKPVFESGFVSCASGERGCHGPNRANPNLPLCVRRDHVIAGEPLSHTRYFLAKASREMSPHSGDWPPWWGEIRRST